MKPQISHIADRLMRCMNYNIYQMRRCNIIHLIHTICMNMIQKTIFLLYYYF